MGVQREVWHRVRPLRCGPRPEGLPPALVQLELRAALVPLGWLRGPRERTDGCDGGGRAEAPGDAAEAPRRPQAACGGRRAGEASRAAHAGRAGAASPGPRRGAPGTLDAGRARGRAGAAPRTLPPVPRARLDD